MSILDVVCDAVNGDDRNAGYPIGGSFPFTYTGGTWGGTASGVFTLASGAPDPSIAIGHLAVVFANGQTEAVLRNGGTALYWGVIIAIGASTITVSLTKKVGTYNTTAAGSSTMVVGGKLRGPQAGSSWPLSQSLATITGTSNTMRVDITGTISMTASLVIAASGVIVEGYGASPGDNVRATLDYGANNVIGIITTAAMGLCLKNLIITNTGGTGHGISIGGGGTTSTFERVTVSKIAGNGFQVINNSGVWIDCEAVNCNTSNTANGAGFNIGTPGNIFVRTISHHHSQSNATFGWYLTNTTPYASVFIDCIGSDNSSSAIAGTANAYNRLVVYGGDFFRNGGSGIALSGGTKSADYIINANFVLNTAYAVAPSTGFPDGFANRLFIEGCGIGSGTQANGSGIGGYGYDTLTVTYPADKTPWVDPTTGNFNLTSTGGAWAAGYGGFVQTAPNTSNAYTGIASSPSIGATQPNIVTAVTQAKARGGGRGGHLRHIFS